MKVAHDDNFIYFYVETRGFDHPSDKHWMNLFISTGNKKNDNWYGYDFVVNRKNPDWDAYLEKCTGGFNWEEAAKLSFKYGGNKLQIAVPHVKHWDSRKENRYPSSNGRTIIRKMISILLYRWRYRSHCRMNYVYSETA